MTESEEEIRKLMSNLNAIISHIYREGNMLAYSLANLAFQSKDVLTIDTFQQLLSEARKIMNMNIKQIPSLRIRTIKIKPYLQSV